MGAIGDKIREAMQRSGGSGQWDAYEHAASIADAEEAALREELAALRARLELAEKVCEAAREFADRMRSEYASAELEAALAAWLAHKETK